MCSSWLARFATSFHCFYLVIRSVQSRCCINLKFFHGFPKNSLTPSQNRGITVDTPIGRIIKFGEGNMIQIYSGDLLQISANGRYYFAIVLDKIRLFGGQLCFVFYRTSDKPIEAEELTGGPFEGFYEIVDFIWAKREDRVTRIAKKLDTKELSRRVSYFKNTHAIKEKANDWWIYDREGRELRRIQKLTEEEKQYPLWHRIDDILMIGLVDKRWSPEKDHRI